jgi:hypothetical protein
MHGANGSERGASGSRLLALSGVAFVVLALISIVGLGGNTPGPDATAAKISSYYVSHESREYLASFVLAASGLFIIGFGIALALATRPLAAVRGPFWPMLLTAGSVLAGGAWIVTAFAHLALTDAANQARVAGSALQALNVLDSDSWMVFNTGMGVLMLGAAGSLIPARGAFRVLGWIALVAGLTLFVPFADFVALLVTAIWLIVASVLLYRQGTSLADRPTSASARTRDGVTSAPEVSLGASGN